MRSDWSIFCRSQSERVNFQKTVGNQPFVSEIGTLPCHNLHRIAKLLKITRLGHCGGAYLT
jgi:hypothetical protein